MKDVVITCDTCERSWELTCDDSLYLQIELSSRPCPFCEAYTLSCHGPADRVPRARRRHGRRRALSRQAPA